MYNIEICEKPDEKVAGRTHIKMSALKISENDNDNNGNGINWDKQFVQNNLQSMIGASYKVCFVDDDKTIPSGHGDMEYNENGKVIFPNSDSVGSIQKAYLQDVNLDGKQQTVLCTEGYIYNQSYPNFVEWLKSEANQGTVFGSVEVNGKGDSKRIVYSNGTGVNSDGSPQIGRKPQIFDFTALAILSNFVQPADQSSRVFEVNSKEGENQKMAKIDIDNSKASAIMNGSWNPDKGSLFKTCKDASNAKACFNEMYLETELPSNMDDVIESDVKYPHHEINSGKMVVSEAGLHAAASRGAANGLSESGRAHLKKHYNELGLELPEFLGGDNKKTKQEANSMDEKVVLELNQKIEDKTKEINDLNNKNTELKAKNTELSEAVTNANKSCEELNAKISALTEELNACKTELDAKKKKEAEAEAEAKKAECNSYFETEIPKNGFSNEEINSLKHFVDEVNLEGLKSAEAEICTKKFKENIVKNSETNVETNSKHSFISIHEPEKKVVSDKVHSFFNV